MLGSDIVNKYFTSILDGSTQKFLSLNNLRTFKIPVPNDEKEIEAIIEKLLSVDNKIRSEQAYLEKLIKIKTGLTQDLLTGKARVKVAA